MKQLGRIWVLGYPYSTSTGGIMILHKLVKLLIDDGFDAMMVASNGRVVANPWVKYLDDGLEKIKLDPKRDIAIYPDVISDNPLIAVHVVRYILNRPKTKDWDDNEFVFHYSDRFTDPSEDSRGILTLLDHDHSKKYLTNPDGPRAPSCHTYRKRKAQMSSLKRMHPEGSTELSHGGSIDSLIDFFNTFDRFYCYDTETYLSVIASLCGCTSIIVPLEGKTREDVMGCQPLVRYGVAYGTSEEELAHAKSTAPLVAEYLREYDQNSLVVFRSIISDILNHFNLEKTT